MRRDVRELESSIGAWTARGVLCAVSPGGEKNVIKKFETQLGDLSSKLTSGGMRVRWKDSVYTVKLFKSMRWT